MVPNTWGSPRDLGMVPVTSGWSPRHQDGCQAKRHLGGPQNPGWSSRGQDGHQAGRHPRWFPRLGVVPMTSDGPQDTRMVAKQRGILVVPRTQDSPQDPRMVPKHGGTLDVPQELRMVLETPGWSPSREALWMVPMPRDGPQDLGWTPSRGDLAWSPRTQGGREARRNLGCSPCPGMVPETPARSPSRETPCKILMNPRWSPRKEEPCPGMAPETPGWSPSRGDTLHDPQEPKMVAKQGVTWDDPHAQG